MGELAAVVRLIPLKIATFNSLGLPDVLKKIAMINRGFVLVTGATGSGKSTTLAAMMDYINGHKAAHIVTIEDPIEYTDNYFDLKFELEKIFNRKIDLLESKAIKNPFLKERIDKTKVLVYG